MGWLGIIYGHTVAEVSCFIHTKMSTETALFTSLSLFEIFGLSKIVFDIKFFNSIDIF